MSCLLSLALLCSSALAPQDLRAAYDVLGYRLELVLDPEQHSLRGRCLVEARVCADTLDLLELDLAPSMQVGAVRRFRGDLAGQVHSGTSVLAVEREEGRLRIHLDSTLAKDELLQVAIDFHGNPQALNDFDGFHWKSTEAGSPWIATSSQTTGSSYWWPSKDSFWHPEDKPERVLLDLAVPKGLIGVANGRLEQRFADPQHPELEHFLWVHDYPLETYSVAINVAPYVEVTRQLELEGLEQPLTFSYWVLPEHVERAQVEFAAVPGMLAAYSKAFGPFPFPKSKFALVEVPYWGMENSTCTAYGSSFPSWCKQSGARDRYALMNRFYDYILIHESAHEWWGNAVSAADWGDFWIHEGFATYAEGVYLELTQSRERADEFFRGQCLQVPKKGSLYRGSGKNSEQAYTNLIYNKGASVLNMLRDWVDDDDAWWRSLRNFNLQFRYKNASTEDFRAVLERETGKDWSQFFAEWVYGTGYALLSGSARVEGRSILLEIGNQGTDQTQFHVPLELEWTEGQQRMSKRLVLDPGDSQLVLECQQIPTGLAIVQQERVLARNRIKL